MYAAIYYKEVNFMRLQVDTDILVTLFLKPGETAGKSIVV